MSAMYDSSKWSQGTPLGVVSPPHRESHASYRSASVDEAENWDALESELAGDGWAYRTPKRVTLVLGDPPSSLSAPEWCLGHHLPQEVAPRLVLLEGRERYRSLAGAASAVGLSEPGSETQSALLLRIGSSEEVVCLASGEVVESLDLPLGSPGRGGKREREESDER